MRATKKPHYENNITVFCCFAEQSDAAALCPCSNPSNACINMPVPSSDSYYGTYNADCIPLKGSQLSQVDGCDHTPREQVNKLTAYIDASGVYGSSMELLGYLRDSSSGK